VAGFEQILITPAAHQVNSLEERNHKESMRHLRGGLCEAEGMIQRSVIAPSAQRTVNVQFSPAIGCSPTTRLLRIAVETKKMLAAQCNLIQTAKSSRRNMTRNIQHNRGRITYPPGPNRQRQPQSEMNTS
jgi:hypothetical protein